MIREDHKTKTNDLTFHTGCNLKLKESVSESKYHTYVTSTTALIARRRLQDTWKCKRGLKQKVGSQGLHHPPLNLAFVFPHPVYSYPRLC
jgi:hypothetical protein